MDMNRDEALTELRQIMDGIDRDELNGGWWETSTGVDFGVERLRQLEKLIVKLTESTFSSAGTNGPCTAYVDGPGGPLNCTLQHGHEGRHLDSDGASKWT